MDAISSLIYSSLSGLVARVLTHPLDTIKTLSQASNSKASFSSVALDAVRSAGTPRVLFNGLGVTLFFSVPATGVYLTTYDLLKQSSRNPDSMWTQAVAATGAEAISGVLWLPMENLKVKLQAGADAKGTHSNGSALLAKPSTMALARDIYRTDGIRGFFRGYLLTQAVFVPYTITYFVSYERFKRGWAKVFGSQRPNPFTSTPHHVDTHNLSYMAYLICASASGAIAGAVSNIFDVVKTRVQINSSKSTWHTIQSMWVHEGGPMAFTKGMLARILWVTPSMAISVSVYELLKDMHLKFRSS